MQQKAMTINDYFAIVKRRKWSLILPMLIIFMVGGIVAMSLPSIYRSTSTILIEAQDIPADFVMTTVTSFAEQRLQSIYQRIVSFSKLLDIINRFNLYPDLKEKWATEKIVEKMREDILLEPISTEIADRRTGRSSVATIAFTLSYEGKHPDTVERVANVMASLFLEENLRVREKQATETSEFLEKEMEKVKANLSEHEGRMAAFKTTHMNELPENLQVNLQSLNNLESNIVRLNEQLRSLKEREGYLQTQLASVSPQFEVEKRDEVRLAELKVQLVHLKSRFSEQYPDIIKTKAEIAELERQVNDESHKTDNPGHSDDPPDNPAYITLASQLSSTQADILSVKRQIEESNAAADMYRLRIAKTPKIEEAYNAILIERNNTHAKYDDLMRKHMEAKVAQGLEKDQKGERFTLIDPARLPETPYKPNRLVIVLIGLVLGIGSGVGWASLRELTDHFIKDSGSLAFAPSIPILGSIPEIVTEEDIQRKKRKRVIMILALVLSAVAGLIVFHFLAMDLNVFWAKLMRKVSL